jgi:hypothetical protein
MLGCLRWGGPQVVDGSFSQQVLLDLARCGQRQLVDEPHIAGDLEVAICLRQNSRMSSSLAWAPEPIWPPQRSSVICVSKREDGSATSSAITRFGPTAGATTSNRVQRAACLSRRPPSRHRRLRARIRPPQRGHGRIRPPGRLRRQHARRRPQDHRSIDIGITSAVGDPRLDPLACAVYLSSSQITPSARPRDLELAVS